MIRINRANTNSLWSGVLVETLVRCGLRSVIISPGSRSSPLTVAFASHPDIEAIPVLDERSAGFFALGIAKKECRPVALVCTSGTAAVNYFPAIVEASEARVPLLVLTADRPPELRDCGAGQTINQIRLYGNYPVFQEEFALPAISLEELEQLRRMLVSSYQEVLHGPVHLNCPFRDPLPPVEDGSTVGCPDIDESFFESVVIPTAAPSKLPGPSIIASTRGVIICGTESPRSPGSYCKAIANLSEKSGWPVLADGLSPVRNFASLQSRLVTTYDFILRNEQLREALKPESVIALGPLPTSKELRNWLSDAKADLYHINKTGKNLDPTKTAVRVLKVSGDEAVDCFTFQETANHEYVDAWLKTEKLARERLSETFESEKVDRFEGTLSYRLASLIPPGTPIFVASSMPVRDVEFFWPPNDTQVSVFASRGANGIDGTLSTALGLAHYGKPALLLTGDLAFLHDSNGLFIRSHFKGHLTVLLINNRGGGIFNHLPIAEFEPPYEEFFATPQEVDFKLLVESAGCSYQKLKQISELELLLSNLPNSGIRVIEIETDRQRDSRFRKELFHTISRIL